MSDPLISHYDAVIDALIDSKVILFLGAGVNKCGRSEESGWQCGKQLPDGSELSEFLAHEFRYPREEPKDLVRVAQYIYTMRGSGPLYDKLHKLLDIDYPCTCLTHFLVMLQSVLSEKGYPSHHQLIVTTNYDDLVERTFYYAKQPFDLVELAHIAAEVIRFVGVHPVGEPDPVSAIPGSSKKRGWISRSNGIFSVVFPSPS